MDAKNNDVKISKIIAVDLDVNITDSTKILRIQESVGLLNDIPADYEKYTLSHMVMDLVKDSNVEWNAINEANYLLKLKKKTFEMGFDGYECCLYPAVIRDNRIKFRPGYVVEPRTYSMETAEWIIEAVGNDIPSMYPSFTCSKCGGSSLLQSTPYCPYCGSRMTNGYAPSEK